MNLKIKEALRASLILSSYGSKGLKPSLFTPVDMAEITLPVSLGEALDKLTILEIKKSKIADERKADCEKEYNVLDQSLAKYREQYAYFYKLLLEINLSIWELQDLFHGKEITAEQGAAICKKILDENDRRFRVKSKLNHAASSTLREQKGYAKKKAFVYSHLGLGDMFWMNGAVRYLATAFDEVIVVCKEKYETNVRRMYADDPTIQIFLIKDDHILYPFSEHRKFIEANGFTVFTCGAHTEGRKVYEFPLSFYDDFGLPRKTRRDYFHVPMFQEAGDLFLKVRAVAPSYIVVHQQSQKKKLPIWDMLHKKNPDRLLLDLNENHYPADHPFHSVAEAVINQPLLFYTFLLINATEIHMIESSIYCMASHLDLSNVSEKFCYDAYGGSNERIGVFETGVL